MRRMRRRDEAEAGHGTTEEMLVDGREEIVDLDPEDPQDVGRRDDRDGDEEPRDEAELDPVLDSARHVLSHHATSADSTR
jgi:hypothetical protein